MKYLSFVMPFVLLIITEANLVPLKRTDINARIYSASLNSSGNRLALATPNNVTIINLSDFSKTILRYSKKPTILTGLVFKDNLLFVGGENKDSGLLYSIDITNNSIMYYPLDKFSPIYEMMVDPTNTRIASVHQNGTINIWNIKKFELIGSFGSACEIDCFASEAFSPEGNFMYTGNIDGIQKWEISSGKKIKEYSVHDPQAELVEGNNTIGFIKVIKNRNIILASSWNKMLILNTNLDIQKVFTFDTKEIIMSFDYSMEKSTIVCNMTRGYFGILNIDTSEKKLYKISSQHYLFVSYYNNEKNILTVSKDGHIEIWSSEKFHDF